MSLQPASSGPLAQRGASPAQHHQVTLVILLLNQYLNVPDMFKAAFCLADLYGGSCTTTKAWLEMVCV